jgi:hypothetical protein
MSRSFFRRAGRGCLLALLAALAVSLLAVALATLLLALALAVLSTVLAALALPGYWRLRRHQISRWLAETAAWFGRVLREQAGPGGDAAPPGDSGPQEDPRDQP